jgi:2-keto-3-deoxy-6-phosphogluconate aldolase
MSAGTISTIRLAIRTLPKNFDRSRIVAVIETIEQELYESGVYANASADSMTIEITVQTDQLLDAAKVLNEIEFI